MNDNQDRCLFLADLDGTLLDDAKNIPPENEEALERITSEGHLFCISTGRALPSALKRTEALGLDRFGCYISACNGGIIYDSSTSRILFQSKVPMDLVRTCFDCAAEFGVNIQAYTEKEVLVEREHPDVPEYCRIQCLPYRLVSDVTAELTTPSPKLLATDIANPDHILAFRDYMQPRLGDQVDMFISQSGYLEIVPPGISKGFALHKICELTGIDPVNTIAAGDAENDLSMILEAGIGAGMCNGDEKVKARADYVTEKDNNHSGVAEILNRFLPPR